MTLVVLPTTWSAGQTLTAAALNAEFNEVQTKFNTFAVLTDVAKTITVTHTWTAAQTFTGGATFGAAVTISSGGLAVNAGTADFQGTTDLLTQRVEVVGLVGSPSANVLGIGAGITTSATAGANGAVPAQVVGYLAWKIGTLPIRVPYFNV
jgi:hypothetical protein